MSFMLSPLNSLIFYSYQYSVYSVKICNKRVKGAKYLNVTCKFSMILQRNSA